ncbi:hypothetical protein LEN26_013605 [Aphanomyces euteiches]|nr:hypothetical protein LEN26_013605 [Aphanomyces euteiches]
MILDLCGAVLAYMASYITTQDHANTTAQANDSDLDKPTHQDLSDVQTIKKESRLDSVNSINDDHHTACHSRNNSQEQGNTSNEDSTTPVHNVDVAQSTKEDNDFTEEDDDSCPFVCAWEVAHLPERYSTEDKYIFRKEYDPDAAAKHKEAMARASAYVDKILDDEGYVRIEDLNAMCTASVTQDGNHIDAEKKRHREQDDEDINKSAKRVKFATTTVYSFPIELGECSIAALTPLGMSRRHVAEETFDLSAIAEGDPSHSKEELPAFVAPPKYDKIPREERLARLRAAGVSDADIHAHAQVALDIARTLHSCSFACMLAHDTLTARRRARRSSRGISSYLGGATNGGTSVFEWLGSPSAIVDKSNNSPSTRR